MNAPAPPAPRPLRVLYVLSLFPCWSETFIVREIHALIEHGADVAILSLKPPSETLVQERAAALLPRARHPRGTAASLLALVALALRRPLAVTRFVATLVAGLWRRPSVLLKSLAALAHAAGQWRWIEEFSPQLIHAPWATYPATTAWFVGRLLGRPFSFTSRAHDIFVEDHLMRQKLAQAALAVTITRNNVRYMARWMAAPGAVPVQVVHSALDLGETEFRRDGRLPRRLLSVGRLDPIKGFDVLIEALARLAARGVAFRCRIIGEGPERGRLEAAIARHDLAARVELAGALAQDAV
ncbi:MAG TPA: glycosyltransferase, partial [Dokdonella sp.]